MSPLTWGLVFSFFLSTQLHDVVGKYSCGRTSYRETYGSFSTPNYNHAMNETINCTYEIEVVGRWALLEWDSSFDVDGNMPSCYNNYVSVSIGCGINRRALSKFCSRNADKPHPIYAKDGCIKIQYRETTPGKRGFKVTYRTYAMNTPKTTSRCSADRNLYSNQGVVVSPGWPVGYKPSYFPFFGKSECEWDLKVSSSRKIKLNFMDVDLYVSGNTCNSIFSDRLKVKGKKSSVGAGKSTRTYCRKYPFSLSSDYYEIELEFDGSRMYTRNNRGFVVGYVSYSDPVAAKNSKIGMIVGGIIVVIIIAVVVFCCYRRRRGREGYVQSPPQPDYQATTITTTTYNPPPPPADSGYQQPYPAQPYYPPQPGYGPTPYPPVDDKQAGYPQMEPPPSYPGPPAAGYPPPQPYPDAAPYPGQPGAAPYPDQSGATPYPPPAGYYGAAPAPYPPPENADMQKPPVPPY